MSARATISEAQPDMPMARPTWQVWLPNTFLFLWLVIGASQFLEVTAEPPEFEDVLYVKTLYENEKSRKTIMPLNCTDDDNLNPVVSFDSVSPSSPCGNCFSVLPDEDAGTFDLIYTPNGNTLTAEHTYYIRLTCRAGKDLVVPQTVEIRMIRNSPPYFNPDQSYVSTTLKDTEKLTQGTLVYNVNGTDNDNDTIFYSMTSEPESENFEIGVGDGIIKAKNDLKSECNEQITFKVMITDNINDPVGPLSVHTTLEGTHKTPEITNLDVAVQVTEDTPVDGTILTLQKSLSKDYDYIITADPSENLDFFKIDSDVVQVKKALDFESPPTNQPTKLTIIATDGFCSSEEHYLDITVTDVNEPPKLYPENAYYSVYEGSDLADQLTIPWKIYDEDQYDFHTYRLVDDTNKNHNFSIDHTTGQLSCNIDWDVDGVENPQPQTLTVEITDKGGNTSQTEVTLYFKDRNDHAPVITTNNHAWRVCATGRKIGALMKTMNCEDEDSSFQGNNDTYFEGGNGLINVDGNGRIIMSSRPAPGVTYSTTAYCYDRGLWPKPLRSSAVYISITGTDVCEPSSNSPNVATATQPTTSRPTTQPTTTELTTTETPEPSTTPAPSSEPRTWLDENLWWLILAGILGALLLGLLMYMWFAFCSKYCSQCWSKEWCKSRPAQPRRLKPPPRVNTPPKLRVRTPPRQVEPAEKPKPPTPPPTPPAAIVGPQDGYIYDFWKERYPDDDYANEPERQNNPRPVTPENKPSGGVENNHEPSQNGPIVPPKNKPPASTAKPKSCVVM